jgi:hypothetical protein
MCRRTATEGDLLVDLVEGIGAAGDAVADLQTAWVAVPIQR